MGRISGRTPEDTRRLAFDAAARVIQRHGVGASLDVIAAEAGLSKGGLVYHFGSKEGLLVALTEELFETFRASVEARLDDGPVRGRLTRAYVRANLEPADGEAMRREIGLLTQLVAVPALLDLAHVDGARWRSDLAADGVPAATQSLVVAAADGFGSSYLWEAAPSEESRIRLRDDLLALVDESLD